MLKEIFNKKAEIIKNTDPDRIYVENIRSFFNLSYKMAEYFCEVAVRSKFFRRKYGIECKNSDCSRIISTYDNLDEIPDNIICIVCEMEEKDQFEFEKNELNIVKFYQLIER
ncbi:hypothetical protein BAS10_09710 [Elizabethkingia meningoseptica]|uniref:hypothetical protein n=1 Tax=Elizabethkingia meningoseptica TaxID=238 RepID=UPI0009996B06|nr:hypothetical protein [Elizabethkingia meningoseptica]OPB95901.1 hypothetical protein BAS10_09710 [Elizabethkingia meningoseptica]